MNIKTLPAPDSELDHHYWMRHALSLAEQAQASGEVPIGAVVVVNNQSIGEGWNQSVMCHDPTAHAEIIALRQAGRHQKNYRLVNATLYVTLEPCMMCVGAIMHSRIRGLVYGAPDPKKGGVAFLTRMMNIRVKRIDIKTDVLSQTCSKMLMDFFQQRRREQKAQVLKK